MNDYRPGDIANGHILGNDGRWHPIGNAEAPNASAQEEALTSNDEPAGSFSDTAPSVVSPAKADGSSSGGTKRGLWIALGVVAVVVVGGLTVSTAVRSAQPSSTLESEPSAVPPPTFTEPTAHSTTVPSTPPIDEPPDDTTPPRKPHRPVSERRLKQIIKSPEGHVGDRVIVFASVDQFDSATGSDAFRGSVADHDTTEYGFFTGENSFFMGTERRLRRIVQGDVVKVWATVSGSFDYETTMGGSTTVPQFEVDRIKRVGAVD